MSFVCLVGWLVSLMTVFIYRSRTTDMQIKIGSASTIYDSVQLVG